MSEEAQKGAAEGAAGKPEKSRLLPLSAFPAHARDTIRFGDTDKVGHVNNAAFSTFLETGRATFLLRPGGSFAPEGTSFVLARVAIDFRAELHWPGVVDIGTRVASVGRSSVSLAQALFQDGKCVATAESVLVLMDLATRRATPLPQESLAELSALMGEVV